jgi:Domain of unknown function (DUF4082)
VTFPSNTSTGWETALFNTPVNVTAGTTYVASYFAPNGHYASTGNFFTTAVDNPPLSAPATTNGVYKYGSASAFPTDTYQATNYWVDPLFTSSGGGINPTPTPTASPTASPTPTPTPTNPPQSIFAAASVPANASWNDPSAIDVGVKFTADVAGTVSAIKFYKGPTNTGTHTGSLWSSTGQLLATATFGTESASGWQTVTFSTPVSIAAGTTYIASYHTSTGNYAVDLNQFQSAGVTSGPLHIPAGGGVYRYGTGGWPSSAANHNYWVDIVFTAN